MSRIPVPSQQKKTGMAIISDGFKRPTLSELRAGGSANSQNEQIQGGFKRPTIKEIKNEPSAVDVQPQAFKPPSIKSLRGNESNDFVPPSINDFKSDPGNDFARPSIRDMKSDFDHPSAREMLSDRGNSSQHVQFSIEQPMDAESDDDDVEKRRHDPSYKPYTVDDYKNMQQADEALNNLGSLGPSHDEEWERKKEMRAKIMQFGKKTVAENKSALPRKRVVKEVEKKESKLDKMKKYAESVPKPKPQKASDEGKVTPRKEHKKKAPVKAKYDIDAELKRHQHFKDRVESLYSQVSQFLK